MDKTIWRRVRPKRAKVPYLPTENKLAKYGLRVIDYDNHALGTVRGLLCNRCNTILGMARDNIEILKQAIAYLNKRSS
jgi:hypothetical protein